jgi:hypothetical protein
LSPMEVGVERPLQATPTTVREAEKTPPMAAEAGLPAGQDDRKMAIPVVTQKAVGASPMEMGPEVPPGRDDGMMAAPAATLETGKMPSLMVASGEEARCPQWL